MLRKLLAALRARTAWTSTLEVAGLAAVTVGAGMIFPPAGFIVGGACLLAVGIAEGVE